MDQYNHGKKHLRDITNTTCVRESSNKKYLTGNASSFLPSIYDRVEGEALKSESVPQDHTHSRSQDAHPLVIYKLTAYPMTNFHR